MHHIQQDRVHTSRSDRLPRREPVRQDSWVYEAGVRPWRRMISPMAAELGGVPGGVDWRTAATSRK
jgi:hypothetical protein